MASKDLLRLVAKMSFEDGYTISEIAAYIARTGDKKNGTVKRVSSLLAEASKWLLRRDKMLADYEAEISNFALANRVREKYPVLQNVLVTRSAPASPDAPWEPILNLTQTRLAAQYFDALTEDEKGDEIRVAVSGGELLLDMAVLIPHHQRQHVHYYASAMIGRGRMLRATHIGPETNAALCWVQSGMISGNLHYATVDPPELSGRGSSDAERYAAAKKGLIDNAELNHDNSSVESALSDLAEVNMVIADIGAFRPHAPPSELTSDLMSVPSLLRHYGVNPELLAEEGAVGYMSYAVFDQNGDTRDDWRFFLNAGYPNAVGLFRSLVEQKQKVIVIAEAGSDPALRAALKGGLLNVLITDEMTAESILEPAPPRWRILQKPR